MDIFFDPMEIPILADTDVTILLDNTGNADHSFVIEELDIGVIAGGWKFDDHRSECSCRGI